MLYPSLSIQGLLCEGAMKQVKLRERIVIPAIIHCACAVSNLYAIPIPSFDLRQLTKAADLIVVAQVSDLSIVGETVIAEQGIKAKIVSSHVQVLNLLFGSPVSNEIIVTYLVPEVGLAYGSLKANSTRLLFLKQADSTYNFANRYYPSLPAVSGDSLAQDDPLGAVIAQEAAVLVSQNVKASDKEEALYALGTCSDSRAVQGLPQDLGDASPTIQLEITSQLALRGNVESIKRASQVLLAPSDAIPSHILHNLRVGIRDGARDERVVPEVSSLLQVNNDSTREAAAEALRRIGSK